MPDRGRPVLWRLVQAVAALAILFFVARQFARNWNQLRSAHLVWQVRPLLLLASAGIVWLMYAALISAWRRLLVDWDQPIRPWTAARIWSLSNLGKYIPGKVWAIAGMALMAQRAGVAAWAATASAILLQALAIGTGAVAVGLTGTVALETAHPGVRAALWLLALGSGAGIALLTSPWISRRFLHRLLPAGSAPAPRFRAVAYGLAANLLAWAGYGLAFWIMARGLLPQAPLTPLAAIGAFTASYLAGFLAVLVPGGLGVREGVFILMLQGSLGLANAAALAVASRLLLSMTEVGVALPFLGSLSGTRGKGQGTGAR